MNYKNLRQLKEQFKTGGFEFPETITIQDKTFRLVENDISNYSFADIIRGNVSPTVCYVQESDVRSIQIDFQWDHGDDNRMIPSDVRINPLKAPASLSERFLREDEKGKRVVGDYCEAIFLDFGGKTMEAKVDTGARISSLHATDIEMMKRHGSSEDAMVKFKCDALSPNFITMPLGKEPKQLVSDSNGNSEYRPVIDLDIEINGIKLSNIPFNLNDRSQKEYPVLIGQNVLEAGKFIVDPSIHLDTTQADHEVDGDTGYSVPSPMGGPGKSETDPE